MPPRESSYSPGNKSWSFNVLDLLRRIKDILSGTLTVTTTSPSSVTLTPTLIRVTGSGAHMVAAGAKSVSIYNAGSADATVLGSTLAKQEGVSFTATLPGETLGAISYDALTSTLLITKVV